ncbi:hypothetical protein P389DRAFT_191960 [Cystobasidium minutum MCA 4210]|uniref:uncharacterized protein n=1 Tax=Cystobasidium minutum MCA 4210 TaxID=1397322 RepID=UPI0034CDEBD1|eukprot:jgi/Rhomi1/191960/gm1.174_g
MNAGTSKDAGAAPKPADADRRTELLAAVCLATVDLSVIATEAFVASLTELVYAQTEALAQDLEAFAKHAGRTCISTEDVLLACRKHPELHKRMSEMAAKVNTKR